MFVSAFLLFLVQPMVGRMLLPSLGGAPAVWNTCVVFFQFILLLGYAYAHWMTHWDRRWQVRLQWALLGVTCLTLPIALWAGAEPPATADPTLWLIGQLVLMVGLPFFAVSCNAPILQRWYVHAAGKNSQDPYFLYALSNLGSLAALLAYPLVIEPRAGVAWQTALWTLGFTLLAAGYLGCGWLAMPHGRRNADDARDSTEPVSAADERSISPSESLGPAIPWPRKLHYLVLAAIPSSLMLGVTTFLATEVGSAPLVWVVPLALYLLSFVIAFSRFAPRVHPLLTRALPILLLVMPVLLMVDLGQFPLTVAGFHLTTFFVIAAVCHGEMARLRPTAGRLTEFYFWMSLGGVVGGSVNALLAPHLFNDVWEYPLALVLAAFLRPRLMTAESPAPTRRWLDLAWPAGVAALIGTAHLLKGWGIDGRIALTLIAYAVPAAICYLIQGGPRVRFALAYAVLLLGSASALKTESVLVAERGFFGVNKVVVDREHGFVMLINGRTMHGLQRLDPSRRHEPLSYYHPQGPMGDLFTLARSAGLRRVGVIGLGTGTLATYLRAGDTVDFYEIDPTVSALAQDPRYFSFLQDCPAQWQIISGDARVCLQRLARQRLGEKGPFRQVAHRAPDAEPPYQLLILDAFSSDSIPSHLVTVEAFQLYRSLLSSDGVIGMNITNKHLNLRPLLFALARELGLQALIRDDRIAGDLGQNDGRTSCVYVVLTADNKFATELRARAGWVDLYTEPAITAWTDDFCNLLDVIAW